MEGSPIKSTALPSVGLRAERLRVASREVLLSMLLYALIADWNSLRGIQGSVSVALIVIILIIGGIDESDQIARNRGDAGCYCLVSVI
jgi:hypothetical protein